MTDATPRIGTKANCKNCDEPIIFEPYYCDGKLPNPPRWYHLPGYFLCWVPGVDDRRGAKNRYAEPPSTPDTPDAPTSHPTAPYEGWISV